MLSPGPTVGHDRVALTPGIQQDVGQDRHVTPPPLVVDALGQKYHELAGGPATFGFH